MSESLRTLIVEDRVSDATLVVRELERAGFAPTWKRVDTEEQYVSELETLPELILADYNMPNFGAMRALEVLREKNLEIPFIIVSGSIGEDVAVEAMRRGAADYLLKDRLGRLGPAVNNALEQSRSRKEGKRAAAELSSTHQQLRHLLAHSPAVLYSLTIEDGNVIPTVVSDNIERLLGVTAEESTHEWWLESLHPDDRERVLSNLRESLSQHGYSMEYRIRHKDGSYHWVEDNNRVVRDAFGNATESVGVWMDITERKRAEERLREQAKLLDLAQDAIMVRDMDDRVEFWNHGAEQLYGWTATEVRGREASGFLFLDDPAATVLARTAVLENGVWTGERHHRCKDGGIVTVRSRWTLVRDEFAAPKSVLVINTDITEQKDAQEAIRQSESRLRALLASMDDLALEFDAEGRYVAIWTMRDDLLSHPRSELLGRRIVEVHGEKAAELFLSVIKRVLKSKMAESLDYGMDVVTGHREFVARVSPIVNADGSCDRVCILSRDVTEQKKLEAQFLRAQRLESIGTLASGVAHDLNNILVPILMAAPLLRDDMPAEEREKLLTIVEASAERGASIVNQVLTFARGADGDRVLLQPIYVVQEIVKIAEKTFPKSIAVRTNYPEDLWPVVANPTQLHQVLLNLCINARDAMPTGGTLALDLENFEVDDHYASMTLGAKAGPHVLLEVRDTGTGISRENIDKIFDPFFTTKELGHGTGLGLSTVNGILKSHGGFMHVYSEVGRGTSFKVFLPANANELAAPSAADAPALPRANGELLLIVDDEDSILQVVQALLEDHGYRVLTAADAPEALAIFARRMNDIELVLTDLAMPFMDGVALIRTLQKMKPGVRVVASTGRGGQDGRANEVANLNVRASLTKPYNKNKLLKTLHDVLIEPSGNHSSANAQLETSTL